MSRVSQKIIILLSSLFLISGCALLRVKSIDTPRVELAPGQWVHLPTPEALDLTVKATQILSAQYTINGKISSHTAEVQLETTVNKIAIVAVSGLGGELFSIVYNGVSIKSSSLPMPNAAMGIKHTLTDFIFTYASPKLLDNMLQATDIRLHIKNRQRIFMLDGEPFIIISYKTNNPWLGDVVLHNQKLKYTVKIQTVSYKRKPRYNTSV